DELWPINGVMTPLHRTPKILDADFSSRDRRHFVDERLVHQRELDFATLHDDPSFDHKFYLPPTTIISQRDDAILDFLDRWYVRHVVRDSVERLNLRRPMAGFHPDIY